MRKSKEFDLMDGEKPLRVRITRMTGQQGAYFAIDICCLLGVESFAALFKKESREIVQSLVQASRNSEEVKRLLDRLLCCCERVTDSGGTVALTPATVDGQVEDWLTVLELYVLSFATNFDFFGHGALDRFRAAANSIGQQLKSVEWRNT